MNRHKKRNKRFDRGLIISILILIIFFSVLILISFVVIPYFERVYETEFEVHIRNETNKTISIGVKVNDKVIGHMNITPGKTSKLKGEYEEGDKINIVNIYKNDISITHKINKEHVIFHVYNDRIEVEEVWY